MSRGLSGQSLFHDDIDRVTFQDFLGDAFFRFGLDCHGYCLMGTHYHVIVHSGCALLSAALQQLNSRYAEAFNRRYLRTGPLFRGRFRSVPLEEPRHLLNALGYVHANPFAAGLCRQPEHWPWSSARAYFEAGPRPVWLKTETLARLAHELSHPIAEHCRQVEGSASLQQTGIGKDAVRTA